ncbi:MAG: hypothetical protein ACOCRA_00865 [Halobacteria archaeon]
MRNAVLVAVCLALLAQPVLADAGGESIEIESVSTVDSGDDSVTVTVSYETRVTTKINTYLFGSEELQKAIVEALGVEGEHVEFERLDADSAEMVYDGGAEDIDVASITS